ncbi:hypothetical protein ACNVED_04135 [Legionella sp. D16C41]|uniref:hypothetical protein n=1 Tax=Legionella sp. D16C41 TaxID=3402688 RepID=UPI003AF51560
MKQFIFNNYFILQQETIFGHAVGSRVELKPSGIEIAIRFYNRKYSTNLTYHHNLDLIEFDIKRLRKKILNLRDYRQAFIINEKSLGHHSLTLLYIKENNEEILLVIDSQGTARKNKQLKFVKSFFKDTTIPTYAVEDAFQSDNYSCHTASLVVAKDCTAKHPDGTYRLANLLKLIKERSDLPNEQGMAWAILPNELLKVPHLTDFIRKHTENSPKPIDTKQSKSLKQFRTQYKVKLEIDGHSVKFNDYLRRKGINISKNIEIQFYLEQLFSAFEELPNELKTQWPIYCDEFVQSAKCILKTQKDASLYQFASTFIDSKFSNNEIYRTYLANLTPEQVKLKLIKAAEEEDLLQVQSLISLTTANKLDSEIIEEVANKALANNQWDIIEILIRLTNEIKLSTTTITAILDKANTFSNYQVLQFLIQMKTDNKPPREELVRLLSDASFLGNEELVELICAMTSDNRPTSEDIKKLLREDPDDFFNLQPAIKNILKETYKRFLLYEQIESLQNYGEELKAQGNVVDGNKIIIAAIRLKQSAIDYFLNPTPAMQLEFKKHLKSCFAELTIINSPQISIVIDIKILAIKAGLLVKAPKVLRQLFFKEEKEWATNFSPKSALNGLK